MLCNRYLKQLIRYLHSFGPLSDFLWDFPTNFAWYQNIPILGNFSLAVILLLGSGIFFTFKLGFIQITQFKKGVKLIAQRKHAAVGISSGAAFFLSTAMRVGPGNIVGVTGAIAVGGTGSIVLDVGICFLWHVHCLCGKCSGADFQGKEK